MFKISSDSYIDNDFFAFRSARLRCLDALLAGCMDEEGISGVVAPPFAATLTMCVDVKANALKFVKENRVVEEGMSVPTCGRRALLWPPH